MTQKDYEIYLSKLPDAINKLFNPEESLTDSEALETKKDNEMQTKKRGLKKKTKGKGK
jgi:hypothetical protein